MGQQDTPKTEIPRLNVVSHIPLSSEMRSHIYQKLLELDQRLPQGSAMSLTLTKVKYPVAPPQALLKPVSVKPAKPGIPKKVRTRSGVEAQVEIFSPNGQMSARGFGTDLFESVSGSVASLIEEIEMIRAAVQGDGGRRAMIEMAKRPQYLH